MKKNKKSAFLYIVYVFLYCAVGGCEGSPRTVDIRGRLYYYYYYCDGEWFSGLLGESMKSTDVFTIKRIMDPGGWVGGWVKDLRFSIIFAAAAVPQKSRREKVCRTMTDEEKVVDGKSSAVVIY